MSCRVINIEIDLKLSSTFPSFQFNSIRSDSISSNPIESNPACFVRFLSSIWMYNKNNNSQASLLDYCIDEANWRQSYTRHEPDDRNIQFKFKFDKVKSTTLLCFTLFLYFLHQHEKQWDTNLNVMWRRHVRNTHSIMSSVTVIPSVKKSK